MPRYRSWDSSQAITKYRELWLRLCDIFPLLMADVEQSEALANLTIGYETYRYKAVVDGHGYMVWMISSSPNFWEKAILPILAEYKAERITWSKHRYNPRAFLVKLPLSSTGVTHFREWVKSGSMDTTTFVRESIYDDDYGYQEDDYWGYEYEDELDKMEEYDELAERFDKKARRKG